MAITCEDRAAITELIAQHGHICDSGELDRLNEVFTADVIYDVTDFGQPVLRGLPALAAGALALGELNPVGHHVTNVVLAEAPDGNVHAQSKGIGIKADGTCGSVTYYDIVGHGDQGWRISERKLQARRTPLGGRHKT